MEKKGIENMSVVEERVKTVSDIVRSVKYVTWCKAHYYPELSQKTLAKLTTGFDPNINVSHVGAFIDTSLTLNGKLGTVYTLTGLYDRRSLEKAFYINYSDIVDYSILPDKKGRTYGLNGKLEIRLNDGTKYTTGNEAAAMAEILNRLIPVVMTWNDEYGHREAGEIGKYGLTTGQLEKCHAIIHSASVLAGAVGTGLAQIPLSDNAVITPIQVAMITSLGAVFELRITESAAKGIIGSVAAAMVGRSLSQLLVGWIPGIGNAINTATAAGITEAIGWVAVKHFTSLNEADRAKHRIEGMKAGYEAASNEYEAKLRKQADAFIKQKYYAREQRDAYEKLLDEYETYIGILEQQIKALEDTEELEVPNYLVSSYAAMTDDLKVLRDLKECS